MARSIPSPLVVPELYSTGRAPIVTSPVQRLRDAAMCAYEQMASNLVADYSPSGLTDGTAASLFYRFKVQKNEQTGTLYPLLRVAVWAVNANPGAAKNVYVDLDGDRLTHATIPASSSVTPRAGDYEFGEPNYPYGELEVSCDADVTIYGVSVYDARTRTALDPGTFASGLAALDSDTWSAEKPCSVGHYHDLLLFYRHLYQREAGQILATARFGGMTTRVHRMRVHLPHTPTGAPTATTWAVRDGGVIVQWPGTSTAATGGSGAFASTTIMMPTVALGSSRPAILDVDVTTAYSPTSVCAWWGDLEDDAEATAGVLGDGTGALVTETGTRVGR